MIMGICCFVWYYLTGKWWWALLTGTLLIWGPMFKQTGMSAIAAVGLFTLLQPILHHTAWKKAGKEVLLLVAGACITLTPIIAWYMSMDTPLHYWPYSFILEPALSAVGVDVGKAPAAEPEQPAAKADPEKQAQRGLLLKLLPGYVSNSWVALDPAARHQVTLRILRYYGLLILPIALALGAIAARIVGILRARHAKAPVPADQDPGRFVLLFGLWWFFDMAFVWISPHTYEQYFLPLNASSAVLGGCLAGAYTHRLKTDSNRTRSIVLGLLGLLAMLILSWHIFFGIAKSPYSGGAYRNRYGELARDRGYRQTWNKSRENGEYPWMQSGKYIRANSKPTDKIYVWGWIPGVYVQAQRMSAAPKAFEGTMHTLPPNELAGRVRELLDAFAKEPPKFIVDTQNRHFPWDRPPLQLWPNIENGYNSPGRDAKTFSLLLRTFGLQATDVTKEGFLLADKPGAIQKYDAGFAKMLGQAVEPAEALRYQAMRPFRDYVMKNYEIVGELGGQVVFRRK